MDVSIVELVNRIVLIAYRDTPTIVGIDGPGASGKSHLAANLDCRLDDCVVVHFDDFYLPDPEKSGHGRRFDWRRLERQVLNPASMGKPIRYQKLDWGSNRLSEWVSIPPPNYLIVEGVYCLRSELWSYYDFRILVSAPYSLRLDRGVERDGESQRSMWVDTWMPEESRYFASSTGPDESAIDAFVDGG